MALSDEVVAEAKGFARVRDRIERLVERTGAAAGFLVDEEGTPFATVGHIEFPFPHPLSGLLALGGTPLLGALLGQPTSEDSGFVVERAGTRALLVLVIESPLSSSERSVVRDAAAGIAGDLDRISAEH